MTAFVGNGKRVSGLAAAADNKPNHDHHNAVFGDPNQVILFLRSCEIRITEPDCGLVEKHKLRTEMKQHLDTLQNSRGSVLDMKGLLQSYLRDDVDTNPPKTAVPIVLSGHESRSRMISRAYALDGRESARIEDLYKRTNGGVEGAFEAPSMTQTQSPPDEDEFELEAFKLFETLLHTNEREMDFEGSTTRQA